MDTLTIIIGGGIILVAITIAIILGNRRWNRILKSSPAVEESDDSDSSPVEHYTKMRDELTLKDAGVEEDETDDDEPTISVGSGFSLTGVIGAIVGAGITLFVGLTVVNTIKTSLPPEELNSTAMGLGGVSINTVLGWMPIMIIVPAVLMVLWAFVKPRESDEEPVREDRIKKVLNKGKGVKHYTRMRDKLSKN